KQSGRIAPAEIGPLSSFRDLVAQFKRKNALKVIMWEEEGGEDMKSILRASLAAKKFVGVVGPEGGFARKEIEFAKQAGFASVSLGHRVLRAETSAISVVAIVQYEWGDMSLIT
ncbi:MAG: RsmE family RNA methyltransferase, partial [Thermodesulfobacteriota bacterium]|nr:RsmE family RNA methyltransferase [Thermodesulfobacteriota bacterium]